MNVRPSTPPISRISRRCPTLRHDEPRLIWGKHAATVLAGHSRPPSALVKMLHSKRLTGKRPQVRTMKRSRIERNDAFCDYDSECNICAYGCEVRSFIYLEKAR
jgi:hypothetical protein